MSNHQNDEGYSITVDLDVPENMVSSAETRLIAAHLGELLLQVIRETDTEE